MRSPKSPWLFAALCAAAVTLTVLAAAAILRVEPAAGAVSR